MSDVSRRIATTPVGGVDGAVYMLQSRARACSCSSVVLRSLKPPSVFVFVLCLARSINRSIDCLLANQPPCRFTGYILSLFTTTPPPPPHIISPFSFSDMKNNLVCSTMLLRHPSPCLSNHHPPQTYLTSRCPRRSDSRPIVSPKNARFRLKTSTTLPWRWARCWA